MARRKRSNLVQKTVYVTRGGKTFQKKVWVKPEVTDKDKQRGLKDILKKILPGKTLPEARERMSKMANGTEAQKAKVEKVIARAEKKTGLPRQTIEKYFGIKRKKSPIKKKMTQPTEISNNTRGEDKKKRKERSDKGQKRVSDISDNEREAVVPDNKYELIDHLILKAGGREEMKKYLIKMRKKEFKEEELKNKMGEMGVELIVDSGKGSATTKAIMNQLVNVTGLTEDEILQRIGLRRKGSSVKKKKSAEVKKEEIPYDETLDPNSEKYRFKDTGYISGARKENAKAFISDYKKKGLLVRKNNLDWESIEENPRFAKEVITKSNLFGVVDWDNLKSEGMEPGAGFLIDRVYASIAPSPEDSPEKRQDYVYGIESLRDRLEKCRTVADVKKMMDEIYDEMEGVTIQPGDDEEIKKLREELDSINVIRKKVLNAYNDVSNRAQNANIEYRNLKYKVERRVDRGWKVDPETTKHLEQLKETADKYNVLLSDHIKTYGNPYDRNNNNPEDMRARDLYSKIRTIEQVNRFKNLESNPSTKAWRALGERFKNVLQFRSRNGSKSFADHVYNATKGNIKDWSWAEKGEVVIERKTKAKLDFTLKVADKFERKGGRKSKIQTTQDLKKAFNLRDVQSGNWVLKDPMSAKFHTEQTGNALMDLSDMLGIKDSQISLNGRLAMAFGARGTGNAGFGGAAKAHYESVERVINLTKMGGGGSLAHEWFHAFDNLLSESGGFGKSGKGEYLTESPKTGNVEMDNAFIELVNKMSKGDMVYKQKKTYTATDYKLAKYNVTERSSKESISGKIRDAGSVDKAINIIRSTFTLSDEKPEKTDKYRLSSYRKIEKRQNDWIKVAVAYYGGNPEGGEIEIPVKEGLSSFKYRAMQLDTERAKPYWSSTSEMAARAFTAYVEDKLKDNGRQNDYLAVYSDNKYYKDPLFGDSYPFPEGKEREEINKSMEKLFEIVSKNNVIQKAIEHEERLLKFIGVKD